MPEKFKLSQRYRIVFQSPDDGYSYFFGYYDKSPLNDCNEKLLAHRVAFDGRDVCDGDVAEVGYFDLNTNKFITIDETLAWNWQQGAQLQWRPSTSYKEIIYNNIRDNKFVTAIYNIETNTTSYLPFPTYSVKPNGAEALAINYERHYWCRHGYNYQNIKNSKWNKPYHEEDGIFHVNFENGQVLKIINIKDIIDHKPLEGFSDCDHWLEHIMYNPSGTRFMFFHRWRQDSKDLSRVYIANAENGGDLFMLPDSLFYSHYDWKTDDELTIWSKVPANSSVNLFGVEKKGQKRSILRRSLGKIYPIVKHWLPHFIRSKFIITSSLLTFKDKSPVWHRVGNHTLYGNGHQSWFKGESRLLNDTYQDSKGFRHLMTYDTENNKIHHIGAFYSQYNDCTYRCDLHPRLSPDKKLIVIDSAHKKRRKLIVIGENNVT